MPVAAPARIAACPDPFYPQDDLLLWPAEASVPTDTARAALRAFRQGLGRRFPPRYGPDAWRRPFDGRLRGALGQARDILDVGAGARPTLPANQRPASARYVGFDVDPVELAAAPSGSYDEVVVGDIGQAQPELAEGFDLVLSWFAFEHAGALSDVLASVRSILRPGGRLLAQFSGRHAAFATLNRLLPERLSGALLTRAVGRTKASIFPARYEECDYASAARILGAGWIDAQVVPLYTSGLYWAFFPPLLGAYLAYEEITFRQDRRQLASYYLIDARRACV